MPAKRKFAVFDVDGTVFRSSLLIELVKELVRDGVFPPYAERMYAEAHSRWLDRRGEYEHYIGAVIAAFEGHLKAVSYADMSAAARSVVRVHRHRVYRYTRDMIRDLKTKGYFLLAVSQSPKIVLDDFCGAMGFDKVYGRTYETGPENTFTGETADVHFIANKAHIMRRAVQQEKLTLPT